MQSIPASAIVAITPSVLGAGGTALNLNGLYLTASTRVPTGQVMSFPSAATVAAFFGSTALETVQAKAYFLGFNNSNKKPGAVLFIQYNTAPVAAYLRGGVVAGLSLTQLQAITGDLSVVIDGVAKTASAVNLSAVTSFSNAASALTTALGAPVTYNALDKGFTVVSSSTGATSAIAFATGTAAAALGLTQATGAVLSQGALAATPAGIMDTAVSQTTNWASFMTLVEPSQTDKLAFAAWNSGQGNRYLYACVDSDITATQGNGTLTTGYLVKYQYSYSGTAMIYQDLSVASFLMGAVAALDFDETAGRATMAFRNQPGLQPTVTDQVSFQNLIANGYNFYGAYATANDRFTFLYDGQVSGQFLWIDSYVNEIWMSNQFQLALLELLIAAKSIPYNVDGYGLIQAACADVIIQALNFGAIRTGVTLSQAQIDEVNTSAGVKIDQVLSNRGYFLQIKDASPQTRASRGSPPCTFWYVDGQSIQRINLATVQVQ